MDFDGIKRDRRIRALRRAVEFLDAGNTAMTVVCQHATSGDDPILGCVCEPSEISDVMLELSDFANELER